MKDFRPLLLDDPERPEALLLRSVCLDEPGGAGKRRLLAVVGAASGVAVATGSGGAAASTPLTAGATVTKVVAVVAIAAGGAAGSARVAAWLFPPSSEVRVPPAPISTERTFPRESQSITTPVLSEVSSKELPAAPPVEPRIRSAAAVSGRVEPLRRSPAERARVEKEGQAEVAPGKNMEEGNADADLREELATLTRARQALRASDSSGALRALDAYKRRFPEPRLEPEATALRVEALVGLGRITEARAVADRLLASASGRAYADRIGAILGSEEPPSRP